MNVMPFVGFLSRITEIKKCIYNRLPSVSDGYFFDALQAHDLIHTKINRNLSFQCLQTGILAETLMQAIVYMRLLTITWI